MPNVFIIVIHIVQIAFCIAVWTAAVAVIFSVVMLYLFCCLLVCRVALFCIGPIQLYQCPKLENRAMAREVR